MARYVQPRGRGLQYQSALDPEFNQQLLQVMSARQNRYDAANQALNEYKTQIAGATVNPYDRAAIEKRLSRDTEEINKLVKSEYEGDYGAALNRLSDEITTRKNYYLPAVQRYQEEQKVSPMVRQLEAQGKLIWEGEDARTKSVYDEDGNFTGIPEYKFRAKDEYTKELRDRFSALGDKVEEYISKKPDINGYKTAIKVKGLKAFSKDELKKIVSDEDINRFINETTFGIDPEYKGKANRETVEDMLNNVFTSQTDKQYIWDKAAEESREASRKGSEGSPPPFLFPKYVGTDEYKGEGTRLGKLVGKLQTANADLSDTPNTTWEDIKNYADYFWNTPDEKTKKLASTNPKIKEEMQELAKNYSYMPGGNSKEKVLNGLKLEQAKTITQHNTYDLNAADGGETIRSKFAIGLLENADKKGILKEIKSGGKYGSEYSGREALEILNGNAADKVPPALVTYNDKDGFTIADAKGKKYRLEVDALDQTTRPNIELLSAIRKEAFDYTAKSIKAGSDKNLTKRVGRNSMGDEFYVQTNSTEYDPNTNSFAPAKYLIQVRNGEPIAKKLLSSYGDIVNSRSEQTTGLLNQLTEQTLQKTFPILNYQNPGTSKTVSVN